MRYGADFRPPSICTSGAFAGNAAPSITEVVAQRGGVAQGFAPDAIYPMPQNVVAGNLVVVGISKYSVAVAPFLAGDLTKFAGTATIGPVSLDITFDSAECYSAVYSFVVTGDGDLTLRYLNNGGGTDAFIILGADEFSTSGTWGAGRFVDSSAGTDVVSAAINSGAASSTQRALFVGTCQIDGSVFASMTLDPAFTDIIQNFSSGGDFGGVAFKIAPSANTDDLSWLLDAPANRWTAVLAVYQPS